MQATSAVPDVETSQRLVRRAIRIAGLLAEEGSDHRAAIRLLIHEARRDLELLLEEVS